MHWQTIPGFTAYEVSDTGLVRRTVLAIKSWHGKKAGELLTPYGKYCRYTLINDEGKKKYPNVNRLVLLAFIGPPPLEQQEAAHWDDNKKNNNLSNLRWATHPENTTDARRNGKINIGSKHGRSILDEDDIPKIISMRKRGLTYREIGEIFGVGLTTIFSVVKGRNWRHIK